MYLECYELGGDLCYVNIPTNAASRFMHLNGETQADFCREAVTGNVVCFSVSSETIFRACVNKT